MFANPMFDQILLLCFFGLTAYAALSDIQFYRIPNRVSLALLLLYPLHVLVAPIPGGWPMALSLASLVFVAGFTLYLFRFVGGGDVKLLAAVSLWAGSQLVLYQLLVMALTGGVLALMAMGLHYVRRYRATGVYGVIVPDQTVAAPKIPYGVAIAAGGFYAGIHMLAG